MKNKMFCLLCLLLLFFPCYVNAQEVGLVSLSITDSISDDGCNTAKELYEFLSSDTGGSVTLTGDIVWDSSEGLSSISGLTQPSTVEMQTYKIIVPKESVMHIEGPVTFRGQGSSMFEIQGNLNLSYGVEVVSSGEKAVALDIRDTSSVSLTYCRIASVGENSTAVLSALPVETGAVTIQLCHISGTAAAITAPSVTLDSTIASPIPKGATVIERVPVIDRSMRLYGISLLEDVSEQEYKEAIYGLNIWNFAFIDPDSGNTIGLTLPSTWSNVPEYPSAVGSYMLTLKPKALPEWFPVDIPAFSVPLNIVDDNTPYITVSYGDATWGFVLMSLVNADAFMDAQSISLFYSIDEGKTWNNVAEDFSGAMVDISMLSVEPLTAETNYLFYAEIFKDGEIKKSNMLYYPNFISDLNVDFSYGGGDMDEDDFGDQGEVPPSGTIIPPPQYPSDSVLKPQDTIPEQIRQSVPTKPVQDSTYSTLSSDTHDKHNTLPTSMPYNTDSTVSAPIYTEEQTDTVQPTDTVKAYNDTLQTEDSTAYVNEEDAFSKKGHGRSAILKGLVITAAGCVIVIIFMWRRKGGGK